MKSKLCLLCSLQFYSSVFNFLIRSNCEERILKKKLWNYSNFQISESLAVKQFVWNKTTFILPPAIPPLRKGQQNSGRPNEEFFLLLYQLARYWELQNCKG